MSVNKFIGLGNVTKDPEIRVAGEHKVATFGLAMNERGYTLANGTVVPEKVEFITAVAWRGLAEIIEKYVKKGDKLYVEGKVKTRSYDDKDGNKRYVTEIMVDNIELLGGKPQQGNTTHQTEADKLEGRTTQIIDDNQNDLPF
jgi:single-strand DNA-binding protein